MTEMQRAKKTVEKLADNWVYFHTSKDRRAAEQIIADTLRAHKKQAIKELRNVEHVLP